MKAAQLQVFTSYSLLASPNRIELLVKQAKAYGYDFLAITDKNVMYGVIDFFQTCKKYDIQPIIGLTLTYQAPQSEQESAIILLAKNLTGYQHLMKISTIKMQKSAQERFSLEEIQPFGEALYCIIPEEGSEWSTYLKEGKVEQAQERFLFLQTLFEEEHLFAGVNIRKNRQPDEWWTAFFQTKTEFVAAQDVRYLYGKDEFTLQVMEHIDEGKTANPALLPLYGEKDLPSVEEMTAAYTEQGFEQAVEKAAEIASNCCFEIPLHQRLLPHYQVPEGKTAAQYLRELCEQYLPLRVQHLTPAYQERLEMELSVIHEMGFDDYFLIIWDVVSFAHQHQIVVGAGRGSAAGSLVSYVLAITDVDPIEYDLLFERFLNIERYTMPDIDLDIPDNRREEVLQYVHRKYGTEHMAQIATFGTMAAKMALRDVARIFGLSQSEANKWSNAVPNVLKITLDQAFQRSQALKKLVQESERNQLLFETACALEGLPRHVSTHAAGIVISDQPLTDFVPLQLGSEQIPLTQFAMGEVEAIGLLKMDFLGLRNLSIIDDALRFIKKNHGIRLELSEIPLDDERTFQLFQKGYTSGVFQFESSGIRNVLRKLGPENLEDIAAVNALYRPGPMENIDVFIQRKKGLAPIEYPDESLREILEKTYGIIVYQEQTMQVASKLAGYTLGEADILRRAISKKKKEVLDQERAHFVEGAIQQGHDETVANTVYDYIERFANYGFNRSHAVAYSTIGYQMAYLKVHYPVAFFTAVLHSVRHNMKKIREYITEVRRLKIEVAPPDINRSEYSFTTDGQQILFGFSSLKGIRRDFIHSIIQERRRSGNYRSLEDFLMRMEKKWLKKENILPLIYIGAFDQLHHNRRQLEADLEGLINNITYSGGSLDLLEMLPLKKRQVADYSVEEKLNQENTYLGIYVSGHPTDEFERLRLYYPITDIQDVIIDKQQQILLYSTEVKKIRTKKGEAMAFLTGNDASGEISVTLFPRTYRQAIQLLAEQTVFLIEGKVERSKYNQETQLLAEKVELAREVEDSISAMTGYLKIPATLDERLTLQQIKKILQQSPGRIPLIIVSEKTRKKTILHEEFWTTDDPKMIETLKELLGDENVIFK